MDYQIFNNYLGKKAVKIVGNLHCYEFRIDLGNRRLLKTPIFPNHRKPDIQLHQDYHHNTFQNWF